jgi:hypothetical protein
MQNTAEHLRHPPGSLQRPRSQWLPQAALVSQTLPVPRAGPRRLSASPNSQQTNTLHLSALGGSRTQWKLAKGPIWNPLPALSPHGEGGGGRGGQAQPGSPGQRRRHGTPEHSKLAESVRSVAARRSPAEIRLRFAGAVARWSVAHVQRAANRSVNYGTYGTIPQFNPHEAQSRRRNQRSSNTKNPTSRDASQTPEQVARNRVRVSAHTSARDAFLRPLASSFVFGGCFASSVSASPDDMWNIRRPGLRHVSPSTPLPGDSR